MPNGTVIKSSNRFGGQGVIAINAGGTKVILVDDNKESFQEFAKTVRFGIGMDSVKSVASNLSNAYKSVSNAKTSADLAKDSLTNAKSGVRLK